MINNEVTGGRNTSTEGGKCIQKVDSDFWQHNILPAFEKLIDH